MLKNKYEPWNRVNVSKAKIMRSRINKSLSLAKQYFDREPEQSLKFYKQASKRLGYLKRESPRDSLLSKQKEVEHFMGILTELLKEPNAILMENKDAKKQIRCKNGTLKSDVKMELHEIPPPDVKEIACTVCHELIACWEPRKACPQCERVYCLSCWKKSHELMGGKCSVCFTQIRLDLENFILRWSITKK